MRLQDSFFLEYRDKEELYLHPLRGYRDLTAMDLSHRRAVQGAIECIRECSREGGGWHLMYVSATQLRSALMYRSVNIHSVGMYKGCQCTLYFVFNIC